MANRKNFTLFRRLLSIVGIIFLFVFKVHSQEASLLNVSTAAVVPEQNVLSRVVLYLDVPPAKVNAFYIYRPEVSLVIDLMDTLHRWGKKEVSFTEGVVYRISSSQYKTVPQKITRVVLYLKEPLKYSVVKSSNNVIVSFLAKEKEVRTPTLAAATSPKEKVTSVKKPSTSTSTISKGSPFINLTVYDADIRDVLRLLAEKAGINIIYGDEVEGKITIDLKNVPFDTALKAILDLRGYVAHKVDKNIIRVTTPDILAGERAKAITYTRVFTLKYALASDVKAQLDTIRNIEGRKGVISIDEKSNSLIITDTIEGLSSAEALIREIDRKPLQVSIDAKLVEITLGAGTDLGIEWGFKETREEGERKQTVEAKIAAAGASIGSISFGLVTNTMELLSKLYAYARDNKANILSNPKIVTLNNKPATIFVGQSVPYKKVISQGVGVPPLETTEWQSVGIKLNVLPVINVEKKINLKVEPEVSLVTEYRPEGPVIGTRRANTTVLISDGQTLVIGGLISETDMKTISKVPLLGDIPVLGEFFKRNYGDKQRSELLVFVTPHVIE
jgi:type IV pilus assembly protein PilQ